MSLDFYLEYEIDGHNIEVFWKNITHNLNTMADKCGLYTALWRPDENGFVYAKDIINILDEGYSELCLKSDYYKEFEAENGWGTYDGFKEFVKAVLEACKEYPNAKIRVSR